MTTHKVKSWAHFFDAIKAGKKLHDLRKMDRDYKVGDILVLQRYDNINGEYTGEEIQVEITYITSNKVPCAFSSSALAKEYGIFSLKRLNLIEVPDCDNPDNPPTIEFFDPREMSIIKKGQEYATGGFVKSYAPFLLGEKSIGSVRVNPTTSNPNADHYQNG